MILLHKLGNQSIMDDSVNVTQIPANAKVVGCYIDSRFRNLPAVIQRFEGKADIVTFGVFLGHLGDFTDVEPGNPINTPELVRADFEHRKAHGVWKPGYYGDRTRMANTILPGLSGIPRSEYRLLLADWTDKAHVTPGYDGDQYESLTHPNIDVSKLAPSFFPPGSIHAPKKHRIRVPAKVKTVAKKAVKIHPKAAATIPGGGAGAAVATILTHSGVHLTSSESAALGALFALLAAYFAPKGQA